MSAEASADWPARHPQAAVHTSSWSLRFLLKNWQANDERASLLRDAGYMDLPLMLLNNPVADTQAKAGSLANGFGGKEWFKYPLQVFFGYANAIVFNLYFNDTVVGARSYPNIALPRNRMERV